MTTSGRLSRLPDARALTEIRSRAKFKPAVKTTQANPVRHTHSGWVISSSNGEEDEEDKSEGGGA